MFASQQVQTEAFSASIQAPGTFTLETDFAWRVLEEIDYGLILVSPGGTLQHANRLGRHELSRARFLAIHGAGLVGQSPAETENLMRALRSAAQGRRQMLALHSGDATLHVACVPLLQSFDGESGAVLLMLSRQTDTQNLNLAFFSRAHGITPAEETVLKALCRGLDVRKIAAANGVTEYTVRTQVRSLRDKTGINSMRLLVQRVASLPPLVPMCLTIQAPVVAQ
jgi:DNA-binding NarL/FixJ family response regulator